MTAVAAGESLALAGEVVPHLVGADAGERPITVDQSNHSVVVGEAVVVKWIRRPAPPPHRGAHLLTHLDSVGFTDMPAFLGAVERDGRVVALLSAFAPGAVDGWDWCVDEMTVALDRDDLGGWLDRCARLGSLTAALHRALATPSTVIPDPVGSATLEAECRRAGALLDDAMRLATGGAAELLRSLTPDVRHDLEALSTTVPTTVQPVHGDLHVGQLLRADGRVLVTDFDGDPVSALPSSDDGVQRRSAVVDLASLVQSIDHVGRVVARRRPDLADAVEPALVGAVNAVVWGYSGAARYDEALLRPLRVVQELHELVYAATRLPEWTYAPVAALAALYS